MAAKRSGLRILRMEHAVTRALAGSREAQAIRASLAAILQAGGWTCARFFVPDAAGTHMRLAIDCSVSAAGWERFFAAADDVRFAPGEGLVGWVWRERRPLWVGDVAREPRVKQRALVEACGVHSAFVFPASALGVEAVISISSPRIEAPERALLEAVEAIGAQIAQFLLRRRAEAERDALLEQLVRANGELERRVQARTQALSASMRELETLTYTIAHDLRAPLRAIDGFTSMLAAELGPKLDEETRELFGLVRGNAGRMAELIDALLAFAQLGRRELEPARLDLRALVREVAAGLAGAYPATRVQIGEIPAVHGDRTALWQAVANLVGNALKFSSARAEPRVEIDARAEGSEVVLRVADNGAGFDMQFADKLFGLFQRLHEQAEFEGAGIGLAVVQRVAERHGGRVWARGEPGRGASFFLALPAARAEPQVACGAADNQ